MKKILFFLFLPLFVFGQNSVINHWDKQQFVSFLRSSELKFSDLDTVELSSLKYSTFSGKGQQFELCHQQPLNDYFTVFVDANKFSQEGVFNRSAVKMHDVDWGLIFRNKSSSYQFNSVFNYQKIEQQENGGLIDYDSGLYDDPLLYPVNLTTAQTFAKSREFNLHHTYQFNENWRFSHSWERRRKHHLFMDDSPDLNFHNQIFIDSLQTRDSLYNEQSRHCFGLKTGSLTLNYIALYEKYGTAFIDTSRFFHGVNLAFDFQEFSFQIDYLQSKQHDIKLNYAHKDFGISFESKQNLAALYHENYHSNHFSWAHSWEHIKKQSLNANYSIKGFSFTLNIDRLQNHLYLDKEIVWQQEANDLYKVESKFSKAWNFGILNAHHKLSYNWVSNEGILRLPTYHLNNDFYLESDLFQNAMQAKIGLSVDYFKAYYALAYSPSLSAMYLQNDQLIGDYPLMTAFIEAQIQSATIRLQARNVSDLFLEESHYVLPDYPYSPMAIEFGVKWEL